MDAVNEVTSIGGLTRIDDHSVVASEGGDVPAADAGGSAIGDTTTAENGGTGGGEDGRPVRKATTNNAVRARPRAPIRRSAVVEVRDGLPTCRLTRNIGASR